MGQKDRRTENASGLSMQLPQQPMLLNSPQEWEGLVNPFCFEMGFIYPKNKFVGVDAKTHLMLEQNILTLGYLQQCLKLYYFFLIISIILGLLLSLAGSDIWPLVPVFGAECWGNPKVVKVGSLLGQ